MMIHELHGLEILATIAVLVGVSYLSYLYALNRTNLAIRLKRRGYYRCPHYQHQDIFYGSDWQDAVGIAAASGTRKNWYQEQFTRYGKTFETKIRGTRIFQTCDAVNAQALLTASADDVGAGPSRAALLSWLGPGAFSMDGDVWKKSRNLLKPVFKKTVISDMSRVDRHLARLLHEVEQEDGEVDLQAHFLRMFLDFFMDLLIGEEVNTVNKDYTKFDAHFFNKACDESQLQLVRSRQPWLVRWWRGWTKDWNQPFETTQAFIDRYVDSAVQDFETSQGGSIERSPAFLDELIREAGSDDKIYLRNQILNVFMPGRDGVAIMVSHVMFHLARHPAVYEQLRAEVIAAGFEREQMSYDAIKNLKYTNAVVNETLRLGGPANGQTVRDILSDIVLPKGGGMNGDQPILIPRGSIVYVQIQNLHQDSVAWGPDPDVFRPERWLESSKTAQRLAFEWLPFGGGRRICPAMALVLGELAYITASFAVRYREIQNRDLEERLFEQGSVVMKIRNGVHVRLAK